MGVDLRYHSMSYQRYDESIKRIAKSWHGVEVYKKDLDFNKNFYCWGTLPKNKEKLFIFNKRVPVEIIEFCNSPYNNISYEKVLELYFKLKIKQYKMKDDYEYNIILEEMYSCIEEKCEYYAC